MTDRDELGPIDYLVVEFPGNKMTGEGMPILLDLVDRGIIRILDLLFIRKDEDGSVRAVQASDFEGDGQLDVAVFEGVNSGLLDEDDIGDAATVIAAGNSAGVMIFENVWAVPFAAALRRGGAELVASGRIPPNRLMSALKVAGAH